MLIGGLQKLSLLDYPGHLAAIIFTQGCNFRCQFCYNPMLVWPAKAKSSQSGHSSIKESDLFSFLKARQGKLEGVVITGGEPTLHNDLSEFIWQIKQLSYKIKIDTNGTNPRVLRELIGGGLVDYIAMDIKSSERGYQQIVGVETDLEKIKESINILLTSNIDYEFRSTIVPGLHSREDIQAMGELIRGAKQWFLQSFKSDTKLVNPDLEHMPAFSEQELEKMRQIAQRFVKKCEIR
ncbi:anaerobic ribonucleoside-triphosphate reductase activating protein [Candidatus Parcubacteria bacterium]|nr:MAG: anaerobic ribonucleoside-triphosphate reductase activating protein [Candidatus Parcubacteria bacterium]